MNEVFGIFLTNNFDSNALVSLHSTKELALERRAELLSLPTKEGWIERTGIAAKMGQRDKAWNKLLAFDISTKAAHDEAMLKGGSYAETFNEYETLKFEVAYPYPNLCAYGVTEDELSIVKINIDSPLNFSHV